MRPHPLLDPMEGIILLDPQRRDSRPSLHHTREPMERSTTLGSIGMDRSATHRASRLAKDATFMERSATLGSIGMDGPPPAGHPVEQRMRPSWSGPPPSGAQAGPVHHGVVHHPREHRIDRSATTEHPVEQRMRASSIDKANKCHTHIVLQRHRHPKGDERDGHRHAVGDHHLIEGVESTTLSPYLAISINVNVILKHVRGRLESCI